MLSRLRVSFLPAVLILVSASAVDASTIVYQQLLNVAASDAGAYSQADQKLAGEFVLGAAATLDTASWFGTMNSADPLNTGDTWSFSITLFNSDAGLPDAVLNTAAVTASVFETALSIQGERVYQFTASFAPVALGSGTSYWLSILNTGTQSTFRWTEAISGLGSALDRGVDWEVWTEDLRTPLNFTLAASDVAVPEPASIALLGMGLAGLMRARRRQAGR